MRRRGLAGKGESMISAKLLHKAMNVLQVIMGWIDLAENQMDPEKRHAAFDRARAAVRSLGELLGESVQRKEAKDKGPRC